MCGGATGYGLDEFRLFEKLGTSDIDADDVSWVVPTPTGGGYSRADDLSPAAVLLDNVWFSNTGIRAVGIPAPL